MPWKEKTPMDLKVQFISRLINGEKMIDLCHEFGISRKTGYKFKESFEKYRVIGLNEQSRRPIRYARLTDENIERKILCFRELFPTWGPKKIKAKLEEVHVGVIFPSASTIGGNLKKCHPCLRSKM